MQEKSCVLSKWWYILKKKKSACTLDFRAAMQVQQILCCIKWRHLLLANWSSKHSAASAARENTFVTAETELLPSSGSTSHHSSSSSCSSPTPLPAPPHRHVDSLTFAGGVSTALFHLPPNHLGVATKEQTPAPASCFPLHRFLVNSKPWVSLRPNQVAAIMDYSSIHHDLWYILPHEPEPKILC